MSQTFSEWDGASPGFLEVDLVAHDGGNPRGDFAQTLDMVDVATQWTETFAVPNKAQRWVLEGLQRTQKNWAVVRRTVGDLRYDRPEQVETLNRL